MGAIGKDSRGGCPGPFEAELGSDPAVLAGDVKINMTNGDNDGLESGKGLVPYLEALGDPPKRVALVSFYVWDCGNKKEASYRIYIGNHTCQVNDTRRISVDDGATDMLATELHDAAIGPLEEEFAAVGMQRLTPAEYLDTPGKAQALETAKVEPGSPRMVQHIKKETGRAARVTRRWPAGS